MRRSGLATAALILALMAGTSNIGAETSAAGAAPARPWYAGSLEKLGFYLFDQPIPAPDFQVELLAGGPAKLSETKGKIALINFWATWCPPCKAEMPSIQKLHEAMKGASFTMMAISVGESKPTVETFVKRNNYTMPVYRDTTGSASVLYGAESIPTTFILDKKGNAIAYAVGSREYASPEAIALFKDLAARD